MKRFKAGLVVLLLTLFAVGEEKVLCDPCARETGEASIANLAFFFGNHARIPPVNMIGGTLGGENMKGES